MVTTSVQTAGIAELETVYGDQMIKPHSSNSNIRWFQHFWIGTLFGKLFLKREPFTLNLRVIILVMMLLVSVIPITAFYKWVERSTFDKEISYVDENHLIIAKNLSAALSRYVVDLKSVFNLAVQNEQHFLSFTEFQTALANYHLCYIAILNNENTMLSQMAGTMSHSMELPSAENLVELRKLADAADGKIVISGIISHLGEPHFFVAKLLRNGNLAVSPWDPKYVIELQKSIAFGERGHSMIVDQNGLVVAHPNAQWQATSKNASKLSVVQAMITGNTGVMQFYSPPMKANMIAGFTFVPETGWGVMVPQPLSELSDRARDAQSAAMLIAGVEIFLAVMISLWLSSLVARPIQVIMDNAREVSAGNLTARVGQLPVHTPNEITRLGTIFDLMVSDLESKTDKLESALKQAEDISTERAKLLTLATQANKVKSQFVSMVSHELRTPLTSIKGSLELLESGALGKIPAQSQNLVGIAVKNSHRLSTMINDLLDLEKLDAGKMRYDIGKCNLATLIADATEANKSYGELSDVKFNIKTSNQTINVKGDYNRLMQVMANLLSNAAKFSSPGSVVDVSYGVSKGRAFIKVTDKGIGIPESAKDKIFDKFVQLDSSDERTAGGSGLGLGIARMIVEKHNGKLTFESVPTQGTTFTFDLPLAETEE